MAKIQQAIYSKGKTYLVGDIVEVTYERYSSMNEDIIKKTVIGKIINIYKGNVAIDSSEKFKANSISLEITDITDIELIGRETEGGKE